MRTRLAATLLLALSAPLLTGCRTYCGYKQWQCDTFGVCMFGTQPGYGRFAPPGPYPDQNFGGAPVYGTPTYGAPAYGTPGYGTPTYDPNLGAPAEFGTPSVNPF